MEKSRFLSSFEMTVCCLSRITGNIQNLVISNPASSAEKSASPWWEKNKQISLFVRNNSLLFVADYRQHSNPCHFSYPVISNPAASGEKSASPRWSGKRTSRFLSAFEMTVCCLSRITGNIQTLVISNPATPGEKSASPRWEKNKQISLFVRNDSLLFIPNYRQH